MYTCYYNPNNQNVYTNKKQQRLIYVLFMDLAKLFNEPIICKSCMFNCSFPSVIVFTFSVVKEKF